jgi:hypothetical protein
MRRAPAAEILWPDWPEDSGAEAAVSRRNADYIPSLSIACTSFVWRSKLSSLYSLS